MKISSNIAVSDSGFIFNPTTGDSFSTNVVGMEIIRILKDIESITSVAEVCRKYGVSENMV